MYKPKYHEIILTTEQIIQIRNLLGMATADFISGEKGMILSQPMHDGTLRFNYYPNDKAIKIVEFFKELNKETKDLTTYKRRA